MVDSARSVGHLNGTTDTAKEPLPSQECSLAALCEMAKELPLVDEEEQEECVQQLVAEDGCTSHVDLFSRVTENGADSAIVVTLMGEQYVIPPCAAFLLSDFTRMQPLVHCEYNAGNLKINVFFQDIWNRFDKMHHNCSHCIVVTFKL